MTCTEADIHTYEGGFSPNTVDRFIENDLNGWLSIIGMPSEQWNKMINTIRDNDRWYNQELGRFDNVLLTYPNIAEI